MAALERTKILVREVMNSPPITLKVGSSALEAARLMKNMQVGSVIIVRSERPVGVVTDKDLVTKVLAEGRDPGSVRVEEIMSTPLPTIEADRDILEAAKLLREKGVKRLGVTSRGRLQGVITMTDILLVMPELVEIVSEKSMLKRTGRERAPGYVTGYCDRCETWSDYLLEVDGEYLCEECRREAPTPEG
ncbi:MAG: inosine-5-monophosphate dehydrogenase [Nitrososphaerota archaeon]